MPQDKQQEVLASAMLRAVVSGVEKYTRRRNGPQKISVTKL